MRATSIEMFRTLQNSGMTSTASELVLVDIDPVIDAIYEMAEPGEQVPDWMDDTSALPCVAPAFESMAVAVKDRLVTVEAYDLSRDDHSAELRRNMGQLSELAGSPIAIRPKESAPPWAWPDLPGSTRWVLEVSSWGFFTGGPGATTLVNAWLPVDADGRSLGLSGTLMLSPPPGLDPADYPTYNRVETDPLRMAMFGLSLLHCRNIIPSEEHERVSRPVRRQRERKGETPSVTYKVLDITPGRGDRGGSGSQGSRLTSMHLCRGHFKTFTEDAPLFGRVVGTYWWAPQVRGSASNGTVHKDYRVTGPPDDEDG